jgi:hypothetical protein
MAISWNEIKDRALRFSKEWEGEKRERAEKDTFWNDFFHVYGINRRRVATFEEPVKKLGNRQGYIDLFWKGNLLVEHKSRGSDLDAAFTQANDYFAGIKDYDLPKYVLVSDFDRFRLYDLEERTQHEFLLKDFQEHVKLFGFIAGYQKKTYKPEDPVNVQAAELMGRIYDELRSSGYEGHPLEVLLVRLLFCLFADDTGIFERDTLRDYIDLRTREDGTDLGMALAQLFQVLDTPSEKRQRTLDEHLAAFPYVNGSLFTEQLPIAAFNLKMRSLLLQCCALDWGKISPAIFGSMFQSVMNPQERRNLGAHYTSETNILKLIKPLFLDELWDEFHRVKGNAVKLTNFHRKIGDLKFFDPACGCGNFLVITYRELRLLEIEVLRVQLKGQQVIDIDRVIWMNVDQFYGIEYDEWPARIAEVAMWLMDHQMNMRIRDEFGDYAPRIPLTASATIVHGNALRIDWETLSDPSSIDISADRVNILQAAEPQEHYGTVNIYARNVNIGQGHTPSTAKRIDKKVDYILGNPPFIGHQWRTPEQMADMELVFGKDSTTGRLDYVAAWYYKAAQYIRGTTIKVAFVSTNSICQGEQVPILWKTLFEKFRIEIHFAHRTFRWSNEAKGNAAVHVVIVGFADDRAERKFLFEYDDINGEPHMREVFNINGYLTAGPNVFIISRKGPIHDYPEMFKGSQPTDGGHLVLSEQEREELIKANPLTENWIKEYIGGAEFLRGQKRYCLWLKDCPPSELKVMPEVLERLRKVKEARLKSPTKSVRDFASFPSLFTQDRQPESDYLCVPEVSSSNRNYVPIGFLPNEVIASNKLQIIPNATRYMFGVLHSAIHNAWTVVVSGRLKSDISYSPSVYHNYPWPKEPSAAQVKDVEEKAQAVLDARAKYPTSSLADLYDPLTMPPDLMKAHQALDKAVDKCYRTKGFSTETERVEFLFGLYGEYVLKEDK